MSGKSLYDVLGIGREATEDDIRKAYRRIALQSHPDRNPGDSASEARFKEATNAYTVLLDPEKRSEYDLANVFSGASGRARSASAVEDVLRDLFSVHGHGFQSRPRTRQPPGSQNVNPAASRPGEDVDAEVIISLEEAAAGCKKRIVVQFNTTTVSCTTCRGTGARPGSPSGPCSACAGRGVRADYRVGMAGEREKQCAACRGRGSVPVHNCQDCRGRGSIKMEREVDVKIPSGVDTGQKLRLAGAGAPGYQSPPGDLIVSVFVKPHPVFRRSGKDLHISGHVSLLELLRCATIQVETIGGSPVDLVIPRGTQPGQTIVVRGAGLVGTSDKVKGDLHVTVDVSVPPVPSARAARLLEELAEELDVCPARGDDPRKARVVTDDLEASLRDAGLGINRS